MIALQRKFWFWLLRLKNYLHFLNSLEDGCTISLLDREDFVRMKLFYNYRFVAISTNLDEDVLIQKSKKGKIKVSQDNCVKDFLPLPYDTHKLKTHFGTKLNILTRVNISLSDPSHLQKLSQSKNLKKYNLVGVEPLNNTVLKALTTSFNVNIISYSPENSNNLVINRKLYKTLVSKGIYFEMLYSPAILDRTSRTHLISLSHKYFIHGKLKNVFVSSGAYSPLHIRAPYDVINLNIILGFSEQLAKSAISYTCQKLLQDARKQLRSKCVIEMKHIKQVPVAEEAEISQVEEK